MSGGTDQNELNQNSPPPSQACRPPQVQNHRSSIISQSQASHSYSQFGPEPDHLTDEELVALVNKLKSQVRLIKLENNLLESTIMRLDPCLMHGVYQALEYATRMNSITSLCGGSFSKSPTSKFVLAESALMSCRMTGSPSTRASTRRIESCAKIGGSIVLGAGPKINLLERSELVSIEMEMLMCHLEKSRHKAAKQHALFKAQLEEVGNRVTNIEKATKSFKQEVIVEGWNKIAQRIPAEIWIRFLREWMKLSDSQVAKLRLRTSTLNTQYSKLKGQIKVKAELSESLRPVDFEKKKIENSECLKLINQKLSQLTELKKMTGDANLNLTIHKKALIKQNSYLTKVVKTTENRKNLTVALNSERSLIQGQADLLAQKLNDIRNVRHQHQVPDVIDYVKVKSHITDLKHGIKMLENRVHIQQISLNSINRTLRFQPTDCPQKDSPANVSKKS
ncbi:unnamed protein product [Chrysodeixis includens]|uniref:Cilia- and flagella-associated protein 263 n=1 Tax=Chrysodeixis includens TaxID=689277 RepID=A0A9P0BWQ9_CHRIL|nr:unnamed protein product [Chrysodeixis includens]